jgi:hypothetical protein
MKLDKTSAQVAATAALGDTPTELNVTIEYTED